MFKRKRNHTGFFTECMLFARNSLDDRNSDGLCLWDNSTHCTRTNIYRK